MGTYAIRDPKHSPDPVVREKPQKKKKWLLWLLLLLLLALLSTVILHRLGYFFYPWENRAIVGSTAKQGPLPGMSEEELKEYLQQRADESHAAIKINYKPVFQNGAADGTLMIQNSQQNTCDMQVKIYKGEDNTGQLLYDSGVLPPDYHIERDKLQVVLPKGEHPAVAYVSFFENGEALNTARVNIIIIVNN